MSSGVECHLRFIYFKKDFFFFMKIIIFYPFVIFSAMPTMLFMTWMEKTCKEDVCEWNLLVTHVIDVEVAAEDDSVSLYSLKNNV